MYQIVHRTTKKPFQDKIFETKKEGIAYLSLSNVLTWNYKLNEITLDKQWRSREEKRFIRGEYFLPDFLKCLKIKDHFLHTSKKDPAILAYTKNELNGGLDIQTKISLIGYIEKYHPDLNKKKREDLVNLWQKERLDKDGLKFATTPEEIVRVYRHGPQSCMKRAFKRLPQHPTYIYGAGDLAIAYLERDGKPVARTLCWPEKRIYSRLYGNNANGLVDSLRNRGYEQSYGGRSTKTFEGARLLAIQTEDQRFLITSLDEIGRAEYKDGFLYLSRGGKYCSTTQGYTPQMVPQKCDSCGKENENSVPAYFGRYKYKKMCSDCRAMNTYWCFGINASVLDTVEKHHYGNVAYSHIAVERGIIWICDKTKRVHTKKQKKYKIGDETWGYKAVRKFAKKLADGTYKAK